MTRKLVAGPWCLEDRSCFRQHAPHAFAPAQALGRGQGWCRRRCLLAPQGSAPCFRPTSVKASTQRSMSSSLCTAEIWTRMRAFPLGTTG